MNIIPLIVQLVLASAASYRGWGFTPFAILIAVAVTGFFIGMNMNWQNVESLFTVLVVMDASAIGAFALMAIVGRSQDS